MSTLKLRLLKKLKCTLKYEKLAWADGAQLVAGVDEVGRGALFGPVVAAAVILKPGTQATDRELRDYAAEHLADFKVPRTIVIVETIPLGPTGKMQRIGLAEKLGLGKG